MTTVHLTVPDNWTQGFWRIREIRYTPVILPYGVHFLSKESEETLRRAKEKADEATARHTKRGA